MTQLGTQFLRSIDLHYVHFNYTLLLFYSFQMDLMSEILLINLILYFHNTHVDMYLRHKTFNKYAKVHTETRHLQTGGTPCRTPL